MSLKILYDYAMKHVGKPYMWGGDDPMAGFDCSGLILELLACAGITFKHDKTAHQLYEYFAKHGDLNRGLGALCFYGNPERVTHVAMFLDDNFIIEAGGGNSKTQTLNDAIMQNAYIRVRHYEHRRDVCAILMPRYQIK